MRIKQLLTKTLLVVALLGVGSMSAWADTDCTASVSATGWLKSNGVAAGATSTNFAPAVSAGSMYEVYEETTETTGVMLYQNISDLANGVYQVDLYANAMYTSGRNFDGDANAARVYLYANGQTVQVNTVEATSTLANGEYTLRNVVVTDGTLKMGMIKNVGGTNWHNIQIKSLTLLSDATSAWTSYVSSASALNPVDVSFFIQNNEIEVDGAGSGNQSGATGWNQCTSVTNYRPLTIANFTNTSGAFTGGYAYENWRSGGVAGQISQAISNIPNGKYKLNLSVYVTSVNGQFIYGKSNGATYKTNVTSGGSTEDCNVDVVVSDNTLEIGLDMNDAGVNWTAIDNARLMYYGTTLINDAVAFNNGGTMAADQWYYFDATVAGTYEFAAGSDLSNVSYTTDGTQLSTSTGTALTASQSLSATRYYFKSTSAQTLTITVPTGAEVVNADIDFSNSITDGAVAGVVNSMALSRTTSSNNAPAFELGYTYTPKKANEEDPDPDPVTVLGDVLRVGNGDGTVTIPDGQLAGTRDEIVITFDYYFGSLSNGYSGFILRDASSNQIGRFYRDWYNGKWYDNNEATYNTFGFDKSKITSVGSSSAENDKICVTSNKTTFELHLNYSTGTMYAKQYTNGTLKQTTEAVSMGSTNPLKTFVVNSNYNNSGRRCWFDNLTIYTIKGDYSIAEVGYTMKYVDGEGNPVKADDTSRTALLGSTVSDLVTTTDKTTFYNDGDIANNNTTEVAAATNKFVYKEFTAVKSSSDATPITELVDGAVITVVYDKYNKYDYSIKQKLGNAEETTLQANSLWEDQTLTYYYPICVKNGDDYYITEAKATTPKYGFTVTSEDAKHTINYTLDARIVDYVEAENMGTTSNSQKASLSSKGTSWCLNGGGVLTTAWNIATDGYYDIEVGMTQRDTYSVEPAPQLKKGEEVTDLGTINVTSGKYVTKRYNNQLIEAGRELTFSNDNNTGVSKWALDYVILRNIPTSVTASIGKYGYATFCSEYALDFTSVDNATAWVATNVADGKVTLTQVEGDIYQGKGLILKSNSGGAAEVTIPVVASSTKYYDDNKLKACLSQTTINQADNGTNYVLSVQGEVGSEAVVFAPIGNTSATVKAGQCYLYDSGTGSRSLSFVFGEETTGISDASLMNNEETVKSGEVYNLNGQLVAAPSNGIYIVDGKKVIIK